MKARDEKLSFGTEVECNTHLANIFFNKNMDVLFPPTGYGDVPAPNKEARPESHREYKC